MRIARVLHESAPLPLLALERDGALYDVAELDRIFATPYDPDVFPGSADFHTRVVALGCAGLAALDDRLRAGERPTEARLLPGSFLWLPPCDESRVLYAQMAPYDAPSARPSFRIESARALRGHDAGAVFPEEEDRPAIELGIAAVLREELRAATVAEAEDAILGYAILNAWCGRDDAAHDPAGARRVGAQLGPVLVTASEVGDVARLRAQVRIDGHVIASTGAGGWARSPAESIAWVSRFTPLAAGDVIGLGRLRDGGAPAPWGAAVELLVERLGKLAGRAVRPSAPG